MITNDYEFNKGDIVVYKGTRMHFPEFFPAPGTFGTVVYAETDPADGRPGCWVDWPETSLDISKTNGNHVCYCKADRLNIVVPADIVAINPELVENVLKKWQNK